MWRDPACNVNTRAAGSASDVNYALAGRKSGTVDESLTDRADHTFELVQVSQPSLAHGAGPLFRRQRVCNRLP